MVKHQMSNNNVGTIMLKLDSKLFNSKQFFKLGWRKVFLIGLVKVEVSKVKLFLLLWKQQYSN